MLTNRNGEKQQKNMKIYHNYKCSKSIASVELLKERNVDFEIIAYLETPLTRIELKGLLAKLKIPAEALIRKGETEYKENFKGKSLSEEEWIDAIIEFPILLQRPIIEKGNKAVIGRPIENVIDLLEGGE